MSEAPLDQAAVNQVRAVLRDVLREELRPVLVRAARLEEVLRALVQYAGPHEAQTLAMVDTGMWEARKLLEDAMWGARELLEEAPFSCSCPFPRTACPGCGLDCRACAAAAENA